ncbi:MAG: pentapeptide repeat-containing protein [Leptolyngbyaceae cyanobacterium MO_188.B28]|nr:pentapeptide repeat-containing protein [Leptolyngbyaceae cyanobacterium MO_188.B28]
MKARELLRLYEAGERNFRGKNLRGQNFKGQNLSEADFSGADIRGANFTKATLRGANFKRAKAGLQRRWAISLVIVSGLLSSFSGFMLGFSAAVHTLLLLSLNFRSDIGDWVTLSVFLILTVGYFIIIIRKGIGAGLAVVVGAAIIFFIGFGLVGGVVGITVAVAITSIISNAVGGAVTVAVAIIGGVFGAVFGAITGIFLFPKTTIGAGDNASASAVIISVVIFVSIILLSAYISWRALQGNIKDAWIRTSAIFFACIGGTSFQGADLTDSDFTQATLKSTDLRNAVTTRTNWHQAKKIDRARVGGTILLDPDVRDLLITHRGARKSYVGLILKGANLIGADLSDADLTEADVSNATFEGAWLERANFTKTQALNTNFHQANLTSACLENWSINSATQLEDAICDYVYLLRNQQERRPSSGSFAPGEFTKLFEEVLDTIDLIFRNGLDWKAFAYSFKQVQVENEDTELAIQSIENKGDGVVVVKVQAAPDADKEKIHSDFTRNYDLALKAVEEHYKAELKAKEEQIQIYRQQGSDMKEIVGLLASRPINVDVKATADSKAMQGSSDQSRKIEIGDVGGDFNVSGSALNLGDISGTVTNTINQLPSSAEPNQPGIKELLTQLQEAIASESTLSEDDKAEALEQVKALAEAGQNPSDVGMKKLAKRATTMLKGIAAGLPTAAKLAESLSQLLPAISSLLGL